MVVEGADARYRSLTVGKVLLDSMKKRLAATTLPKERIQAAPLVPVMDNLKLVRDLDMTQKLAKPQFDKKLEKYQGSLNLLSRSKKFKQRSLILVFEGSDAAGKGGAVRRITGALDARQYAVTPVAAPTEEERAQPYMWRFWRSVPRLGRVTIFDRSWYGRVLVERVEHLIPEAAWTRAYDEINAFESQITEGGNLVLKFWLHLDPKEQLRRFNEREEIPYKSWKITEDDWRNRANWNAYEAAANDMIKRTSTPAAPWHLIPANDKRFARITIMQTAVTSLERALRLRKALS